MDANTAIVLAGLVIVAIAWMGLVLGTLAALVRDAFDVRRRPGPVRPSRRRRAPRRRSAKAAERSGDSPYEPLSWEALEGK